MFAPGPRTRLTLLAIASLAMASPSFFKSSLSQLHADNTAVGKLVAGTDSLMPSMSAVSGCFRSP